MSRRRGRTSLGLVVVLTAGLLTGCLPSRTVEPEDVPVPDDVIFDAVSDIPGVTGHDLVYSTNFGYTGYSGDVVVSEDADPACVLDTTLALLWQGRDFLSVSVRQGDEFTTPQDLDPDLPLATTFVERYGASPDDGVLRDVDPPACQN